MREHFLLALASAALAAAACNSIVGNDPHPLASPGSAGTSGGAAGSGAHPGGGAGGHGGTATGGVGGAAVTGSGGAIVTGSGGAIATGAGGAIATGGGGGAVVTGSGGASILTGAGGDGGHSSVGGAGGVTGAAGSTSTGAAGSTSTGGSPGGAGTTGNGGSTSSPINLITNGDFSQGTEGWTISGVSPGASGVANGEYCVTITSATGQVTVGWGSSALSVSLVGGASYTLSYQASTTSPLSHFDVKMGMVVSPYNSDYETMTDVPGAGLTSFTHIFTPVNSDSQTGVAFILSTSGTPTVCLDNLSLIKN